MELKRLHKDAVPKALAKAERYRYLFDPSAAESICRDILEVDPDNQQAVVMLLLSLTDQFQDPMHRVNVSQAMAVVPTLKGDYQKHYYQGIIAERWGKAQLHRGSPGANAMAYEYLREAMDWYEQAEKQSEAGNDEAILRWNSCVRAIKAHSLAAPTGGGDDLQWHD